MYVLALVTHFLKNLWNFSSEVTLGWFGLFLAFPAFHCIQLGGNRVAVSELIPSATSAGALLLLLGGIAYTLGGLIFTLQCLETKNWFFTWLTKVTRLFVEFFRWLMRPKSHSWKVRLSRNLACILVKYAELLEYPLNVVRSKEANNNMLSFFFSFETFANFEGWFVSRSLSLLAQRSTTAQCSFTSFPPWKMCRLVAASSQWQILSLATEKQSV